MVAVAAAMVLTVLVAALAAVSAQDVVGVVGASVSTRVAWQRVILAWLVMAALAASSLLIAIWVTRRRARLRSEPFEALPAVPRTGAKSDLTADAERAPHPIGEVAGEVQHRWHDQCYCENRQLEVKVDPEASATEVPGRLVTHVLDVLIDNALRHGWGDVTLTARQFGETLAVEVADEGSIAMESAAVFDCETSRSDGQRTGLALARSMVESRGGRLVVGRRSPATFTLLLPGDTPDFTRPGWLTEQRTSPG
jgi:hypothetical protein